MTYDPTAFAAYKTLEQQRAALEKQDDELLAQMDDCWLLMSAAERAELHKEPGYDHDKVEAFVEDARRGTGPAIWMLLHSISGLGMTTVGDFQAELRERWRSLSTAEQANVLFALANEACAAVMQRARERADLARRKGEM